MYKNLVTALLLAAAAHGYGTSRDSAANYLFAQFGRHFTAAQMLLANQGHRAAAWWQARQLPSKVLLAVVAPELMRYHTLADAVEVISLEMMYVNFGRDYADFSVGYFQIKPSFAEGIEKYALLQGLPAPVSAPDTADTKNNRQKRLERLASLQGQAEYIALFHAVMMHRFPQWHQLPAEQQVQLLATAYNAGWHLSLETLQSFAGKQFFAVSAWEKPSHNYARVAWYFFKWLDY